MLKLFKIVAFLEGTSYIAILANMLFIKPNNLDLYQMFLFPIGMAHGILFIAYLLLAIMLKAPMKWSGKDFFLILFASIIPFGTFWVERKYLSGK